MRLLGAVILCDLLCVAVSIYITYMAIDCGLGYILGFSNTRTWHGVQLVIAVDS